MKKYLGKIYLELYSAMAVRSWAKHQAEYQKHGVVLFSSISPTQNKYPTLPFSFIHFSITGSFLLVVAFVYFFNLSFLLLIIAN